MKVRTPMTAVFLTALIVMGAVAAPAPAAEKSNDEIRTMVENQLALDPAVSAYQVRAKVLDGVVTLEGSVDNLLAKQRADGVARLVKGVRSVVNRIEIRRPEMRTDEAVRLDIQDAFRTNVALDDPIEVAVDGGAVTLRGTVDSWQERNLAEKVAEGIRGVTEVSSFLDIVVEQDRSDAEIRADVESRLHWDALVNDGLIEVGVRGGKVVLGGTVGSAAEKARAIADAYVIGAQEVEASGLVVKPWAEREQLRKGKYRAKDDNAILQAVNDALFYDPRVSPLTVEVSVSQGRVTLRGRVKTLKARQAAGQDARNTVGVVWVENLIQVRPTERLTDEKIRQRLQTALGRDPYLYDEEIRLRIGAGIARLSGTVGSFFEKAQAEEIASHIDGIVAVENNLRLEDGEQAYVYDPYMDDEYIYVYDHNWHHLRSDATQKSDATIKVNIQTQLAWNPLLDENAIAVDVRNGTATLSGAVDSWAEYRTTTACAFKAGAGWVDNDLRVR